MPRRLSSLGLLLILALAVFLPGTVAAGPCDGCEEEGAGPERCPVPCSLCVCCGPATVMAAAPRLAARPEAVFRIPEPAAVHRPSPDPRRVFHVPKPSLA